MKLKTNNWYLFRYKNKEFFGVVRYIPRGGFHSIEKCKKAVNEVSYVTTWKSFFFPLFVCATDFKKWNLAKEDIIRPASKKEVRKSILSGKFEV